MQISNLTSQRIYKNINAMPFSYRALKSDVFILSCSNSSSKKLSFSGLFQKRSIFVDKPKTISMGSNIQLSSGEKIEIPKESFSISFNSGTSFDLNSLDLSKKLLSLENGESFNLMDDFCDSERVSIYKEDNAIFLRNESSSSISLPSDSCFKNYNEDYLKSKFHSEQPSFYSLLTEKYKEIRRANYDENVTFPCGRTVVEHVSKQASSNIMVLSNGGWFFRIPKLKTKKHSFDSKPQRISLNVVANPAIIEELDSFFITGKYTDSKNNSRKVSKQNLLGINYKVPSRGESWLKRHDPITIYKKDSFSSEVIEAIACISEKYKRMSSNNVALVGALDSKPWIALEDDSKEEDFIKIKNKAEKYNSKLAEAMCFLVYEKWNCEEGYTNFSASTGMINSCRFLLDEYIEYIKNYNK